MSPVSSWKTIVVKNNLSSQISLKMHVEWGKIFSFVDYLCQIFNPKVTFFLHLDLFSNHKDWFHKINIKMINSSQIKNKCQESIFHAQNDSLKILCYLLAIHIVPLSFSITNVPFESYFEIYRTLLQSVCCFSLGS